jgi:TonB family protein
MSYPLGSGHYEYHIFMDGAEVLHSGIPVEQREAALDRMIAKRIRSAPDGALKVFIGPEPEYPDHLRKAKIEGHAVVAVRVSTSGRPLNPTVKTATDPAFGESALAAVRLWRFLPVVRKGQPVETSAEIPFDFAPPGGK